VSCIKISHDYSSFSRFLPKFFLSNVNQVTSNKLFYYCESLSTEKNLNKNQNFNTIINYILKYCFVFLLNLINFDLIFKKLFKETKI